MDKRLEEQLERVRELSARVARIHEQLAQNTELIERDRERITGTPLHEVRDLRTWRQGAAHAERHERRETGTANRQRATADSRSGSRRRRRG